MSIGTLSPFATVAPVLRSKGYSVMPVCPDTKIPGDYIGNSWRPMRGWSRFCHTPVGDVEFDYWMTYPDAGICLALGEASGIIALDFDQDIDGIHDKVLAIIPDSPVKKVGEKGFTAFYQFTGEKSKKFSKDKVMVFEILSKGNQTVIPPTIHPDTKQPYTWRGKSLTDFEPSQLPALTAQMIEDIYNLFQPTKETLNNERPSPASIEQAGRCTPIIDDIENALSFIEPDDYYTWVQVGMALKAEYNAHGFVLWDNWSRRSSKYKLKETQRKWASFNDSGISIATVYKFAQDAGYINMPPLKDSSHIDFEALRKPKEKPPKENTSEKTLLALTNEAPHTLGLIIDFILKTSQYPQPILALGASIALLGSVQAHKIRTEANSRTNIFSLGLAHSGAGKDHARQVCMHLLHQSGMKNLIGGDPASATGILKSLDDGEGRRIMFMDEFGRVQEGMKSNASSHMAAVPTTLLKLFSSAGGMFYGNEYANRDGKSPRVDIDQPCLSIYATSVPSRLYRSLSSMDAIDGFLSRWLIFESNDYPPLNKDASLINGVPSALLDDLTYWAEHPTNMNPKGNLSGLAIDPAVVPLTPEALDLWNDYAITQRQRCRDAVTEGTGMEAVYSRLAEHAQKIALIAHDYQKRHIDGEVMRWALALVTACGDYMVESITSKISDNQHEADSKLVLDTIRHVGTITLSKLCRKLRKLDRKKRNDILSDLVDSGEIVYSVEPDSMGRNKVATYSAL